MQGCWSVQSAAHLAAPQEASLRLRCSTAGAYARARGYTLRFPSAFQGRLRTTAFRECSRPSAPAATAHAWSYVEGRSSWLSFLTNHSTTAARAATGTATARAAGARAAATGTATARAAGTRATATGTATAR